MELFLFHMEINVLRNGNKNVINYNMGPCAFVAMGTT
jgi:hypothetical protein